MKANNTIILNETRRGKFHLGFFDQKYFIKFNEATLRTANSALFMQPQFPHKPMKNMAVRFHPQF